MPESDNNMDLAQLKAIWPSITERLPPNERTWLSSSQLKMVADGIVIIAVPNAFSRTQIEGGRALDSKMASQKRPANRCVWWSRLTQLLKPL